MIQNLVSLIEGLSGARALVVGDAMLDVYSVGTSVRQSPEAPVPVVVIHDSRYVLGGAANVAANMASLGADVRFICLAGHDAAHDIFLGKLAEAGIAADGAVRDDTRPTTVKERISMNGAPLARLDREAAHDIGHDALTDMRARISEKMDGCGIVVLSDYCKGVLPDEQIRWIVAQAEERHIPVVFDSKKKDWACFKGALFGKPNRKELHERSGGSLEIEAASRDLINQNGLQALLVSLSEEGVSLITRNSITSYPATARFVTEVSGAGDTLLSLTALALAAGADLESSVYLGNMAAGLAVEMPGTAVVGKKELIEGVLRYQSSERSSA